MRIPHRFANGSTFPSRYARIELPWLTRRSEDGEHGGRGKRDGSAIGKMGKHKSRLT